MIKRVKKYFSRISLLSVPGQGAGTLRSLHPRCLIRSRKRAIPIDTGTDSREMAGLLFLKQSGHLS
jgi:hypothetical protein